MMRLTWLGLSPTVRASAEIENDRPGWRSHANIAASRGSAGPGSGNALDARRNRTASTTQARRACSRAQALSGSCGEADPRAQERARSCASRHKRRALFPARTTVVSRGTGHTLSGGPASMRNESSTVPGATSCLASWRAGKIHSPATAERVCLRVTMVTVPRRTYQHAIPAGSTFVLQKSGFTGPS